MSLQKKLISLEEKYPNKLNKKYFHECNLKSDESVQNCVQFRL